MRRVHFQVRVGVFKCQQVLTKISFVIFDIVVKKQIECGLALSVLLSTTIRVFTAAKMCCETVLREFKIVVLIYSCIGRHKQNVHGNLNGFSVTFSIIFTSYL